MQGLQSRSAEADYKAFTILAHPRDGFFGYMYQLGVDPFDMSRKLGTLEEQNPVFETATCDYDGMELINGKRFDLVRTATVGEMVNYSRCRKRINAATSPEMLNGICPDEFPNGGKAFAECVPGERFSICQSRNRTALAWLSLDEGDELPRVLECLFAALEPFDLPWRVAPDTLAASAGAGRAERAAATHELINALAAAEAPRGLIVLDDLHRVDDACRRRQRRKGVTSH